MKKIILITAILMTTNLLFAQIINIPADYPTIQQGIDAANEGDTVLVQPGTYIENLQIFSKNLVLGSLFLTTNDTSYISQTIIDGNQEGSVLIIYSWAMLIDSTCVVSGFTLTNGYTQESGGGILCAGASPTLTNLIITNNQAEGYDGYGGGGIACLRVGYYWSSNPSLEHVVISNNSSTNYGGGMYCAEYASPKLKQVVFNNNSTDWTGGAMYCIESFPVIDSCTFSQNYTIIGSAVVFEYGCNGVLTNSIIDNNSGLLSCGGIDCYDSDLHLENSTISNNQGPGLYLSGSDPTLKNVSIHNNGVGSNLRGGGIYCVDDSHPVFDDTERCNVYFNHAYQGNEIYSETLIEVIVDTFTVMNPTSFHAAPLENISFDILHAKVEQADADLYVSSEGDNSNTGLTANEPLKNIFTASTKLLTGPENNHTIFLAEGTYSPSTTGEVFPVMIPDYTSLEGISESDVILDADSTGSVISVYYGIENEFSNITLTGAGSYHYGIFCQSSDPIFQHLNIVGNYGEGIRLQNSDPHILDCSISGNSRGALICHESSPVLYNIQITNNTSIGLYLSRSDPILENIQITNNSSQNNGGGMFLFLSNPTLKNVLVGGNTAPNGGGFYMQESDPIIQNVAISNNVATDKGGGIYMSQSSSPILTDVIINGNSANIGGGIHCDNSNPIIQNSTLVENISASIYSGGIRCVGGSNINLTNSVLWNNSPVQIFIQGVYGQNNVAISYSDIQDGEDGIVISGTGILDWQEGNINEDPMFVMSGDHPYQINDYSPCIDAGTPDTTGLNLPEFDIAGNPRFVNNRIDMGAYEWNMFVGVEEPVIDETETAKVSIYPNPFNDHLFIDFELENETNFTLEICNVSGKRMKVLTEKSHTRGAQHFEVKTEDLPPGIYFLRLQAGNAVETKKVVKL